MGPLVQLIEVRCEQLWGLSKVCLSLYLQAYTLQITVYSLYISYKTWTHSTVPWSILLYSVRVPLTLNQRFLMGAVGTETCSLMKTHEKGLGKEAQYTLEKYEMGLMPRKTYGLCFLCHLSGCLLQQAESMPDLFCGGRCYTFPGCRLYKMLKKISVGQCYSRLCFAI